MYLNCQAYLSGFKAPTKRGGNAHTPDYYLANTGLRELNFSGALGYHKGNFGTDVFFSRFDTKLGVFTGSHFGNITDLKNLINSNPYLDSANFSYSIKRPLQAVNHNLFKVNSHYYFNNLGRINVVYALQHNSRKEYDAHTSKNSAHPEVDFQLYTHTGELVLEHKQLGNILGSIGLSGMQQLNVFIPNTRRLIPNFKSYNGGIFLIERFVKEKWELEGGVRYDYKWLKTYDRVGANTEVISKGFDFKNYTASLGGLFHIDHHFTLRVNMASAWRAPTINELFFYGRHHGSGRFIKGDSSLKSETSYNFNTTLSFKGHGFDIEFSPYVNYINNYIYLKPEISYNSETSRYESQYEQTISGAYPSFIYTKANANFKGFDLTFKYQLKKFNFHSTTSIVRVKDRITKEYIEYIPADRFQNSIRYNFKNFGKIKSSAITLTNISALRQSRVPENQDFLAPPAGYSTFNADLNFSILVARQLADFGISVNNILNTRYRDYLNSYRYYADELGRSFIVRMKVPFQL